MVDIYMILRKYFGIKIFRVTDYKIDIIRAKQACSSHLGLFTNLFFSKALPKPHSIANLHFHNLQWFNCN
jgi:hypothetical protein